MRTAQLIILVFLVTSGCQSFRYYDPAKKHRGETRFYNNYDNSPHESFWKWQWQRLVKPRAPELPFQPEVLKTDTEFLKGNRSKNTFTWVGHATALLQLQGRNILIDPVFSERVSPFTFLGPKRQVALPFTISQLPNLDVVLVSHSHYDHLDIASLKAISAQSGGKTRFLVPLGNAEFLTSEGIQNVREFDWWEEVTVEGLQLTFTPAQHWTQRSPWDYNQSLWGGWSVKLGNYHFFYSGDTGYSKDFSDIYEKLGPVDVAMIPIGAYEPRWFMGKQHVDPAEAVQIHQDLHARASVGVHWGTFNMSDEPLAAPPQELAEALQQKGLSAQDFRVLKHGETWMLGEHP